MKKPTNEKQPRPLKLQRETLAHLATLELAAVRGGMRPWTIVTQCGTGCI